MKAKSLIHVVDDDESLRDSLLELLRAAGYEARGYASTGGADCCIQRPTVPAACCSTSACPVRRVSNCKRRCSGRGSRLPVIFMTGHADVTTSVRAMKAGAVDFLEKPVARETLFEAIDRALGRDAMQRTARDEARERATRLAVLTPSESAKSSTALCTGSSTSRSPSSSESVCVRSRPTARN